MRISSTLLKPQIFEIKNQLEDLTGKLHYEFYADEMAELRMEIQRDLETSQKLMDAISGLEHQSQLTTVPSEIFTSYKKLKMELRAAQRTWARLVSNHKRSLKIQKRKQNASSVAA